MYFFPYIFLWFIFKICNLKRKCSETLIGSIWSRATCSDMPNHHFFVLGLSLSFEKRLSPQLGRMCSTQKSLRLTRRSKVSALNQNRMKPVLQHSSVIYSFCHTEKWDLEKVWSSCFASSILLVFKLRSTPTTHIGRWFRIYMFHLNYEQTTNLSQLPRASACLGYAPVCMLAVVSPVCHGFCICWNKCQMCIDCFLNAPMGQLKAN